MKTIFGFLLLMTGAMAAHAADDVTARGPINQDPNEVSSYYDWAQGNDGWGHCYEFTSRGDILNGGMPVADANCELVSPSRARWARGRDNSGYCFLFARQLVLNGGMAIDNQRCEEFDPSFYEWARSNDGFMRCFQFTGNGIVMNRGFPVDNQFCR